MQAGFVPLQRKGWKTGETKSPHSRSESEKRSQPGPSFSRELRFVTGARRRPAQVTAVPHRAEASLSGELYLPQEALEHVWSMSCVPCQPCHLAAVWRGDGVQEVWPSAM